jgi:hypothetical protein
MITGWVGRKNRFECSRDDVSEIVFLDSIPCVENENAAGPETRRASENAFGLSGKNHGAQTGQTTASKVASRNGSCMASAWRHCTGRLVPTPKRGQHR